MDGMLEMTKKNEYLMQLKEYSTQQQNESGQTLFTEMSPLINARGPMQGQPPIAVTSTIPIREMNYLTAREHLTYMRKGLSTAPDPYEPFHWLRKITSGSSATLSSKRSSDGRLQTDMEDETYNNLLRLTSSFYGMAETLADVAPRGQELTLYRAIRIPRIKRDASGAEIEGIMGRYGDVIPSSASWGMETPEHFAIAEEGQDAVIFHMTVPPDFPIVMLSYPEEKRRAADPDPLCIPGQQEVLVGASTFSDVHLLQTEEKEGYRLYHVGVRLNAVPRKDVEGMIETVRSQKYGKKPVNMDHLSFTETVACRIFNKQFSELEVGEIYERPDCEGERYKLMEKGFMCIFERISE